VTLKITTFSTKIGMRFYINIIEEGSDALTVDQPRERLVMRDGW
jgi:hypothetical protein